MPLVRGLRFQATQLGAFVPTIRVTQLGAFVSTTRATQLRAAHCPRSGQRNRGKRCARFEGSGKLMRPLTRTCYINAGALFAELVITDAIHLAKLVSQELAVKRLTFLLVCHAEYEIKIDLVQCQSQVIEIAFFLVLHERFHYTHECGREHASLY